VNALGAECGEALACASWMFSSLTFWIVCSPKHAGVIICGMLARGGKGTLSAETRFEIETQYQQGDFEAESS